jgi:hypothetical protein
MLVGQFHTITSNVFGKRIETKLEGKREEGEYREWPAYPRKRCDKGKPHSTDRV